MPSVRPRDCYRKSSLGSTRVPQSWRLYLRYEGYRNLTEIHSCPCSFLCFIKLRKAHNSVDCFLLWQVLARFEVPPRMIAVVRQFHYGMGAYVRNDNGVCTEEFDVEQGLHQGCVLSPLLFTIFFATATLFALNGSARTRTS